MIERCTRGRRASASHLGPFRNDVASRRLSLPGTKDRDTADTAQDLDDYWHIWDTGLAVCNSLWTVEVPMGYLSEAPSALKGTDAHRICVSKLDEGREGIEGYVVWRKSKVKLNESSIEVKL